MESAPGAYFPANTTKANANISILSSLASGRNWFIASLSKSSDFTLYQRK